MCKENGNSLTNEDENMIRRIIEALQRYMPTDELSEEQEMVAWLEKQGDLTIRFFTDEFEWALGRIITFWNQNHKDGKYDENELMSYIKIRETELVKLFTNNVCKVSLSDCSEEYRKAYYDGYNKCNRDWLKIDISVEEYNKNAEILLGGQGEQKSIDDLTQQEAMDIAVAKCFEQGEQKFSDKVEPKFKVGDWVVYKNDICQIVKREEGGNKLVTTFGIEKELVNERNLSTARLWTIQDAREGDVLDMACELLNNFYNEDTHSYLVKEDIEGFRKAMEEQQ